MQDFSLYFMSISDIYTPFQKATELKTAGIVKQLNLTKIDYMTRFTFSQYVIHSVKMYKTDTRKSRV